MKPILSAVLAAVLWGLNFHFAKIMLEESNFIEAGTWRYIVGVIGVFFFLALSRKDKLQFDLPYKGLMLVGFIGLFGFNLFFFSGLIYTSPVNAALIVALNPITTIILSAFILKTGIKRHQVIGAIVSFAGVLYLLTKGNFENFYGLELNKGDLLIFIGNILFGFHNVWVKKYKKDMSNLQFTAYTNLICLFGFLIALLFSPIELSVDHSQNYWLTSLGIGFLGTAAAYLLWNYCISKIGANRTTIYINLVPLAAAISASFFGVSIYGFHYISGLIILVGVAIIESERFIGKRRGKKIA